jgi:hypothetical protein
MREAGFEPAHPEIVGLKSTALDHSAIRAQLFLFYGRSIPPPFHLLENLFKSFIIQLFRIQFSHAHVCYTTGECSKTE